MPQSITYSYIDVKSINVKSFIIEGSSSGKFLGITIDNNFPFKKHINELPNS